MFLNGSIRIKHGKENSVGSDFRSIFLKTPLETEFYKGESAIRLFADAHHHKLFIKLWLFSLVIR